MATRNVKHLSGQALTAIRQKQVLRAHYAALLEALDLAVERVIERDTGVCLDRGEWVLDLENGYVERATQPH